MTTAPTTGLLVPAGVPARVPAPGRLDRLARRLVLANLAPLAGGRLTIVDADGLRVVGDGEGDLQSAVHVHDPRAWRQFLLGGSLGAAEAYLRGWYSCDDLPAVLRLFARNLDVTDGMEGGAARLAGAVARLRHRRRRNTRTGSRRNIEDHYDLGNDLYALFLDESMTYSCAVFERPDATLAEAQSAKLERICRALHLSPGDHVLEIGSGWGSFAIHAARRYGCRVTTTTISPAQHELATARVRAAGLADRVEVRLRDYRDLDGTYDRIVSIEMIEAVGHEFLDAYFGACRRLLRPDGRMALQAILMPDHRYASYRKAADFIQRYVFPGSSLPSPGAITAAVGRATDLRLVHLDDLTPHYAETLRRWRARFIANLDRVRALGYPPRFERLWDYYLSYCEAGFAERTIGVAQLVLAGPGDRRAPIAGPRPGAAPGPGDA
ncbi:MAG: class I SAM-dependent methyltransferase [Planctomycetota bacterium]|jgi:cyclopropane-fatty-acyl-phospholipid synthase